MNSLQNDVQNFSQTLGELKVLMKNIMAGKRTDDDRFRGSVLITQLKNFNAQGITKCLENNRFRNRVNNIIRNHKVKFYSDLLLKGKNDIKETWKIINDILSRKKQNHDIKKIVSNNVTYIDRDDIASVFNDFET